MENIIASYSKTIGVPIIIGRDTYNSYCGFEYETWRIEWENIFNKYNIKYEEIIVKEITLCIFSLCQFINYNKKGYKGRTDLMITTNQMLHLSTSDDWTKRFICFMKCQFNIIEKYKDGKFIVSPVLTKRINGVLVMMEGNEILLEVK